MYYLKSTYLQAIVLFKSASILSCMQNLEWSFVGASRAASLLAALLARKTLKDLRLLPLLGCPEVPASERPPTVMYGRASPGVGTPIDAAQGALRMAHLNPLMLINCTEKGAEVARILRRNSKRFDDHRTCRFFNSIQLLLARSNDSSNIACIVHHRASAADMPCLGLPLLRPVPRFPLHLHPNRDVVVAHQHCPSSLSLVLLSTMSCHVKKIPLCQQGLLLSCAIVCLSRDCYWKLKKASACNYRVVTSRVSTDAGPGRGGGVE